MSGGHRALAWTLEELIRCILTSSSRVSLVIPEAPCLILCAARSLPLLLFYTFFSPASLMFHFLLVPFCASSSSFVFPKLSPFLVKSSAVSATFHSMFLIVKSLGVDPGFQLPDEAQYKSKPKPVFLPQLKSIPHIFLG